MLVFFFHGHASREMTPVNLRPPPAKDFRTYVTALQFLEILVQQCVRAVAINDGNGTSASFDKVRTRLHQMEFYNFTSGEIVKSSKVLGSLSQIVNKANGVDYPWDIQSDASVLLRRYENGLRRSHLYFDVHLLRGIVSHKVKPNIGESKSKRGSGKGHGTYHRLDASYALKVSCNVTGHNGLHNGQWWPLQICALRDGAHGEIEAGIHGRPGEGAFSVILSAGGGYNDVDKGTEILYCGTASSTSHPTAGTTRLLESYNTGDPVRVLRSAGMRKGDYFPKKGIRYDGLYKVESFEVKDAQTAMHQFRLLRLPGQPPIRYQGPECRPTKEELDAYSTLQNLMNGRK